MIRFNILIPLSFLAILAMLIYVAIMSGLQGLVFFVLVLAFLLLK